MRRVAVALVNLACLPLVAVVAAWDRADAKLASFYARMGGDDE